MDEVLCLVLKNERSAFGIDYLANSMLRLSLQLLLYSDAGNESTVGGLATV